MAKDGILFSCWVFTLMLFASCENSNQIHTNQLTVADLKFPPLYNIRWEEDDFFDLPKPNRKEIKDNHIRSCFSYIDVGLASEYPKHVQELYQEIKPHKESFTEWYWHHTGCLDSSSFDELGNLLAFQRNCLMCGTTRYKYDTLGFIHTMIPGGCVIREYYYHYYFDPNIRCLYYSDTSVKLPAEDNVKKLYFDTLGYLQRQIDVYLAYGYILNVEYKYNEQMKISSIVTKDSIIPGSNKSEEPGSSKTSAITTYFYAENNLDSIITNYMVHRFPEYNRTQKTYFDSSGLPSKSIYINFLRNRKTTEVRMYRYHKE